MTKRLTRSLALSALMSATIAVAAPAFAQTQIRVSTSSPADNSLTRALQAIEAQMETAFPDDIDMSVHHSNALFKQGTELPALQRGNLEMSTPVTFEIEAQMPEYGVFSAAYLFRDADHMLEVFNGEVGERFYADVAEKLGIVILDAAYLGTRTVNLRDDRSVMVPGDLAGTKMRMPPAPAFQTLARALGATAVSMPITEVYLALKTGAIDGQDNPANLTRDWKFDEQTEQVILTRHLVQPVFISIAKPVYDSLTPEQQTELRAATEAAVDQQIAETKADEQAALEQFAAAGMTVAEPDLDAFRAAVAAEYEANGSLDDWVPGLYEQIVAMP
ncbi:TRAP transporter substrate-binding protein DctP [Jannaschia sp. 2305UL9-9]|uniref:TRAP transporter substrate-binding protein DctP n=1 Tax=Jannaschia sp. 2305UL9-9 TaxID=3121638 RepID=UPI0035270BA9